LQLSISVAFLVLLGIVVWSAVDTLPQIWQGPNHAISGLRRPVWKGFLEANSVVNSNVTEDNHEYLAFVQGRLEADGRAKEVVPEHTMVGDSNLTADHLR
jgi:hypothetical protein